MWTECRRFLRAVSLWLITALAIPLLPAGPACAAAPVPVSSQASYEDWILDTGRPLRSRYHAFTANYAAYRDYRLLVYGTPGDVPGNRYDAASGQYAVLGYSYDEFQVTNTYFPNDSPSLSDPRRWKNISLGQDSELSWKRLSPREKEHIKSARLYFMGQPFGNMSFSSLKLTESMCVVTAIPSWYLGFALYTNHYNSRGELRYATLHGNGIGSIDTAVSLRILSPSGPVIRIPADREYVDITWEIVYTVTRYNGLAIPADLAEGGVSFRGAQAVSAGSGPWRMSRTVRYYRTSTDRSSDFTRRVTEKADGWAVSDLGDLSVKSASASFSLIEEAQTLVNAVLSIKGAISLFRKDALLTGTLLPRDPLRFLCGERLTVRLTFTDSELPSAVSITPPGHPEVRASVLKTGPDSGYAEYSYYLDVVPSTLTWDNRRRAPPYRCSAYATVGNRRTDYAIEGIEVTGSVYDILYLDSTAE